MYNLIQKNLPLSSLNLLQNNQKNSTSLLESSLLNSETWIHEFENNINLKCSPIQSKGRAIFQKHSNLSKNLLNNTWRQLQNQNR